MTFAIGGSAKVRRVVKTAESGRWIHACQPPRHPLSRPKFVERCYTRCPDCGTRRP